MGIVVRVAGVRESSKNTKSQSQKANSSKSKRKATSGSSSTQLANIEVIEVNSNEIEKKVEGYKFDERKS